MCYKLDYKKDLSCRFMKAGEMTYSRWVTYRGQKPVIKAEPALLICILFRNPLGIYELNGLFVKLSFVS